MRDRRLGRRIKSVVSGAAPPVGPTITSLSPNTATQYDDAINPLTVNGTGFQLGDVVYWEAGALATTYVSPTQLTAVVPKTLLYTSGVKSITVNGTSNTDIVTVSAWSVASITGVTAWWRADDIVENPAGFVQTMNARVGAFTMTQTTAANRPELITSDATFNNKPSLRRNSGISQFLTSAAQFQNLCTSTDGTLLVVGCVDVIAAATQILFSTSTGGTNGIYAYSAGNGIRTRNFDGSFDEAGAAYTLGTAARLEWRHTGGTLFCRVNNTEASVASGTTTSGLTTTMGLFVSGTGANTFRIAEAVSINVPIGATDRIRYNNYIEDRYNIPA